MQLISENCDPGYCCSPWENRILFTGFAVPLHYLIILLHYFIIYAFKNPLRSIKMLHLHCSALGFFRWFFSSFSSAEVSLESQNPSGSLFQCQVVHVQAWALAFLGSASHSEEGSSPCALGAYSRDLSHPVLFLACKWAHKHLYLQRFCLCLELWGPWATPQRHRGARDTSSNPN